MHFFFNITNCFGQWVYFGNRDTTYGHGNSRGTISTVRTAMALAISILKRQVLLIQENSKQSIVTSEGLTPQPSEG